MKKLRIAIPVGIALLLVLVGALLTTGFYVDPPILQKTPGQTVWFYRRLVRTPFVFSADSIALQNGAVPSEEVREAISRNVQSRIARFVIARFPFSRGLYLRTTGNRDFLPKEE